MWWPWFLSERLGVPRQVSRGLGAARHLELGENALDVVLDCLLGEFQVRSDLPVRLAGRYLDQDALFLGREPGKAFVPEQVLALAKPVENAFCHGRVEQVLPSTDSPNGPHQVTTLHLLEHISGSPGHDRGEEGLVI